MNINKSSHRFQLISPIQGNKMYICTSLYGGAKKCYNELKSFELNNEFVMKD